MSHAIVSHVLVAPTTNRRVLRAIGAWVVGIASLIALAKISIPLPYTPVPLTGQTFGVALIALVAGRRLGSAIVAGYLTLGLLGAPIFAHGSQFVTGATAGYLVGMLITSIVVGTCADLGWTRSWWGALLATYAGSAVTFATGLLVLSRFVPTELLLSAGLYPFVVGDTLKNITAATVARLVRPQQTKLN